MTLPEIRAAIAKEQAKCEAATDGPWSYREAHIHNGVFYVEGSNSKGTPWIIAEASGRGRDNEPNAALIASARIVCTAALRALDLFASLADGFTLYCETCHSGLKPEAFHAACPVCGNGTVTEVTDRWILARFADEIKEGA